MLAFKVTPLKRQAVKKKKAVKKTVSRPGLLSGSTRKASDWQIQKTGQTIKQPERRKTIIQAYNANNVGTTVLYTTPAGKQAKLVYMLVSYIETGVGDCYFLVDSKALMRFVVPATSYVNSVPVVWKYEEAPDIITNVTITRQNNKQETVSIMVIEEDISEAYYY